MARKELLFKFHGDRKGQYGSPLSGDDVLVMVPNHNPLPMDEDGEVDLSRVTAVTILGIIKYRRMQNSAEKTFCVTMALTQHGVFGVNANDESDARTIVSEHCGHKPSSVKSTLLDVGWDFDMNTQQEIYAVIEQEDHCFAVDVSFTHTGKFYVHAASTDDAKELVEKHCGLRYLTGRASVDGVTWRFPRKISKAVLDVKQESQYD